MKVFADLHHGDLYYSLYSLFEKRLGWELYRPIGLDWFHQGYWKIAEPYGNAMDTVRQYLDENHIRWDKSSVEGMKWDEYIYKINGSHYQHDGIYYIYEPVHKYYQRAVTLEQFKSMEFNVILPTIESHDRPFIDLQEKYQPKAKVVAHLGNTGQVTPINNILSSVPYAAKHGQNVVTCHQEIDSNAYKYVPPDPNTKNIFSVVNCYPYPEIYQAYKHTMPDINFKYYGGGSPDGSLFGAPGVGEKMREANIGWHLKPLGGVGHSAMGWLASGRPVITNMNHHRDWGGDAVRLFEPGVTCIDSDSGSFEGNCKKIREVLEPEELIKWCERAYRRFHDVINYNEEEQNVRKFFAGIL